MSTVEMTLGPRIFFNFRYSQLQPCVTSRTWKGHRNLKPELWPLFTSAIRQICLYLVEAGTASFTKSFSTCLLTSSCHQTVLLSSDALHLYYHGIQLKCAENMRLFVCYLVISKWKTCLSKYYVHRKSINQVVLRQFKGKTREKKLGCVSASMLKRLGL